MFEAIVLIILFGGIAYWVWWMNKDNQPKYDFGPTKEEHGWFYYVWNWKTYAFYAMLIVFGSLAFYEGGIQGTIGVVAVLYGLKLLGRLL